jgi:hypothetical protein
MYLIKKGVSGNIDTTDATAAAAEILVGETAYINELKITGTMPNIGAQAIVPTASGNAISLGYHNGTGGIAADADFVAENIKAGINIWNVSGTFTADGDATSADLLLDKIAYVNGAQVVGTIPTITESLGTYSTVDETTVKILAPEGYCDGTTSLVTVTEANLLAENIKEGITIFGITGTYTGV